MLKKGYVFTLGDPPLGVIQPGFEHRVLGPKFCLKRPYDFDILG